MRVLVTGHNGYIGTVMVPMLRAAGHDVVGLDTFFFERAGSARRSRRCRPCGWTYVTSRAADLAGFDAIIHLAALSTTRSAT